MNKNIIIINDFQNIMLCHLQSQVRTHAVLVIGLYELLGNPTT